MGWSGGASFFHFFFKDNFDLVMIMIVGSFSNNTFQHCDRQFYWWCTYRKPLIFLMSSTNFITQGCIESKDSNRTP
jgi:hypothetical protein